MFQVREKDTSYTYNIRDDDLDKLRRIITYLEYSCIDYEVAKDGKKVSVNVRD